MNKINPGDRYYIEIGSQPTSKLEVVASQFLPINTFSTETETVNGELCTKVEIAYDGVVVPVWIPEKRIIEPVPGKFENRLGAFGIYYNYFVHTPGWRQVSNTDRGLKINQVHNDEMVFNGIPCRLATVNGDTPFKVYIPFIKN